MSDDDSRYVDYKDTEDGHEDNVVEEQIIQEEKILHKTLTLQANPQIGSQINEFTIPGNIQGICRIYIVECRWPDGTFSIILECPETVLIILGSPD